MKYVIEYRISKNHNLNNKLFIYDFGDIKGFLYNENFIMYNILTRNSSNETVELYEKNIPKTVFSIEEYECEYSDGVYKLRDFDILVTPFLKVDSLEFYPSFQSHSIEVPLQQYPERQEQQRHQVQQQQQQQQKHQVQQQQKQHLNQKDRLHQHQQHPYYQEHQQHPIQKHPQQQYPLQESLQQPKRRVYRMRNSQVMNEANLVEVNKRVQQVTPQKQSFLEYPNAVKPQWTSLEQLMKVPSSLVNQSPHIQQRKLKQRSPPLMPNLSFSSQLRPLQVKTEKLVQSSTNLD